MAKYDFKAAAEVATVKLSEKHSIKVSVVPTSDGTEEFVQLRQWGDPKTSYEGPTKTGFILTRKQATMLLNALVQGAEVHALEDEVA